jgi:predicted metal-dependent phosphoesterase TrpH
MSQEAFRFDMHIHSAYSCDGLLSIEHLLEYAKRMNISAVAITDHNTIEGAQKAQRKDPHNNPLIIVGEEISTDCGDLTGIFLQEPIRSRIFAEVIDEIHEQNGISIFPHPMRRKKFPENEVMKKLDFFEVINSRTSELKNDGAAALSTEFHIPAIAGSDSHFGWEIGSAWNSELGNDPTDEEDLRLTLNSKNFEIHGIEVNPLIRKSNMMLSYLCKQVRKSCIQR